MGEGEAKKLVDYTEGVTDDNPLNINLSVEDNNHKVILFHNKTFTHPINHFEYCSGNREFFFVMQDGNKIFIGHPLSLSLSRHIQNAHQILTVHMDDKTGQAVRGEYIPVLLQHS